MINGNRLRVGSAARRTRRPALLGLTALCIVGGFHQPASAQRAEPAVALSSSLGLGPPTVISSPVGTASVGRGTGAISGVAVASLDVFGPAQTGPTVLQGQSARPSGWRPLRIAKWTVLLTSAGIGVYGFLQNDRADESFRDLESMCQAEPLRCARRTPGGAYEDAQFERLFQDVRSLDGRSHTALLLSQVGVATGVVLFLLDLGNAESPSDIPFVPTGLEVGAHRAGGVSIGLQWNR